MFGGVEIVPASRSMLVHARALFPMVRVTDADVRRVQARARALAQALWRAIPHFVQGCAAGAGLSIAGRARTVWMIVRPVEARLE